MSRIGWTLYDPVTNETFNFPVNPYSDNGSFGIQKNVGYSVHAGMYRDVYNDDNIGNIVFSTGTSLERFSYTGRAYTLTELDNLVEWSSRNNELYLTDDLGRLATVIIDAFEPKREKPRTRSSQYKHEYSFSGLIITGFTNPAVPVMGPSSPPVAVLTASTTSGDYPLAVSFSSSSSYSNIVSRAWDFGDGGTSTATSPNHSFATAGTYNVTLTVTDGLGETAVDTTTITVSSTPTVVLNVDPVARFTRSPSSGPSPLTVAFNSSTSSDADGTIVSRSWDFGDSTSSTATNPSHTYSTPGVYTVTLTVTDNDGGTDTATSIINALGSVSTSTTVFGWGKTMGKVGHTQSLAQCDTLGLDTPGIMRLFSGSGTIGTGDIQASVWDLGIPLWISWKPNQTSQMTNPSGIASTTEAWIRANLTGDRKTVPTYMTVWHEPEGTADRGPWSLSVWAGLWRDAQAALYEMCVSLRTEGWEVYVAPIICDWVFYGWSGQSIDLWYPASFTDYDVQGYDVYPQGQRANGSRMIARLETTGDNSPATYASSTRKDTYKAIINCSTRAALVGKPWGSGECGLIAGKRIGGDSLHSYTSAQRAAYFDNVTAQLAGLANPPKLWCWYGYDGLSTTVGGSNITYEVDNNVIAAWNASIATNGSLP